MNIQKLKHKLAHTPWVSDLAKSVKDLLPNNKAFLFSDITNRHKIVYKNVRHTTMCSETNVYTMLSLVEHLDRYRIPGDIVECGVWRGGMSRAMMEVCYFRDRNFYLYDTFAGMATPTVEDGELVNSLHKQIVDSKGNSVWCLAGQLEVLNNVEKSGYPLIKIHTIKGKVEDTINEHSHQKIALLRLDTDWYSSTKHELEMLYDKVSSGGVIVIDDYNAWKGSKKATDEFFRNRNLTHYKHRIDSGAIYFFKL